MAKRFSPAQWFDTELFTIVEGYSAEEDKGTNEENIWQTEFIIDQLEMGEYEWLTSSQVRQALSVARRRLAAFTERVPPGWRR